MNVHKDNVKDVFELYNLLRDKGFLNKVGFYVAPVHAWGNDAHKVSVSKEVFGNLELELMIQMIKDGFSPKFLPDRRHTVCMSVDHQSFLFNAEGKAYSCTEIPLVNSYNQKDYILFDLNTSNTTNLQKRPFGDWYDKIYQNRSNSPCYDCNLLPVCGGHCPKNWEEGKGTCPPFKHNFDKRLKLLYHATNH